MVSLSSGRYQRLGWIVISLVEADKQLLNDSYIKKWYILSIKEELLSKPKNVFVEK